MERRNIPAAGKLDDYSVVRALYTVIALQTFPQRRRLHPNDAILPRIVILLSSENLTAEKIFFKAALTARQALPHDEFEERLELVRLAEWTAGDERSQLGQDLFRTWRVPFQPGNWSRYRRHLLLPKALNGYRNPF